tara:strand:- start:286 stop:942 length:657 start_codon:yes stop_codon:yes gene_type:complete
MLKITKNELDEACYYAETLEESYTTPTHTYGNEQVIIEELDDNVIEIHVSGSNDPKDWGQNLSQRIVPLCDYCDYPFHKGFARASDNVMRILANERLFRKDATYSITGHSKGGAVAVAVGLRLESKGMTVLNVTTFASPMFSTKQIPLPFKLTKYETVGDIVPRLPIPTLIRPCQRWISQGIVHRIGEEYDEHMGVIRDIVDVHMISYYKKCLYNIVI